MALEEGPVSFLQTSSRHVLVLDQFQLESLHFIDSVNFHHVATENMINIHNTSLRLKCFYLNILPTPLIWQPQANLVKINTNMFF